jgi:predicted transposase YbfD/YdcC
LDYTAIEGIFKKWLMRTKGILKPKCIAIDGKTVRKSGNALHKAAHIVTAYSSDLQLVLGQVLTDEKSNEVTAIPELLDTLDIAGGTVTIDAIGTQTAIAEKIIDQGADYILALKENQPTLCEDARLYFKEDFLNASKSELAKVGCYAQTLEQGHGRIDNRECWLMKDNITALRRSEVWEKLSGIAVIRSTRTVTGDKTSETYRYYLYSHENMTAEKFLALQRQHWSVENSLHWVLDVVFREDSTHARAEHIAIVLNLFRKLVLLLLKHDATLKGSMAGKREICAWRFDLALQLLIHADLS